MPLKEVPQLTRPEMTSNPHSDLSRALLQNDQPSETTQSKDHAVGDARLADVQARAQKPETLQDRAQRFEAQVAENTARVSRLVEEKLNQDFSTLVAQSQEVPVYMQHNHYSYHGGYSGGDGRDPNRGRFEAKEDPIVTEVKNSIQTYEAKNKVLELSKHAIENKLININNRLDKRTRSIKSDARNEYERVHGRTDPRSPSLISFQNDAVGLDTTINDYKYRITNYAAQIGEMNNSIRSNKAFIFSLRRQLQGFE